RRVQAEPRPPRERLRALTFNASRSAREVLHDLIDGVEHEAQQLVRVERVVHRTPSRLAARNATASSSDKPRETISCARSARARSTSTKRNSWNGVDSDSPNALAHGRTSCLHCEGNCCPRRRRWRPCKSRATKYTPTHSGVATSAAVRVRRVT